MALVCAARACCLRKRQGRGLLASLGQFTLLRGPALPCCAVSAGAAQVEHAARRAGHCKELQPRPPAREPRGERRLAVGGGWQQLWGLMGCGAQLQRPAKERCVHACMFA